MSLRDEAAAVPMRPGYKGALDRLCDEDPRGNEVRELLLDGSISHAQVAVVLARHFGDHDAFTRAGVDAGMVGTWRRKHGVRIR